jgi:hypothetical protein
MQPKRSLTPREEDARDDWGILVCLVCPADQRPWTVADLIRELGDEPAAIDAIGRLRRSGLIHRSADDVVIPTRAAIHYTEIKA